MRSMSKRRGGQVRLHGNGYMGPSLHPTPPPGHNDGQIRHLPTTSLAGGNKGSFTRTVNITVFMSGTFDLFDVVCKQLHIATLNLFLSGTNVTGLRLLSYQKNMVEDDVLFTNHLAGK